MGSLYQQKGRDGKPGGPFWIKFYVDGQPRRESTGTVNKQQARNILKDREGRVVTGQPILPRADRVRYEEIAADLRAYYRTSGRRNLTEAEKRLKHLDASFTGVRVVGLDPPRLTAYVEHRQQEGAANGTINRELGVLSKMLRLAYENNKLLRLTVIRKLKEADPRSGFFEPEQFEAVRRRLPEDLQVAVTLAYTYGWRMQTEVLALEGRHLDLEASTVRLDAGMTKNRKGRVHLPHPRAESAPGRPGGPREGAGAEAGADHPLALPAPGRGHAPHRVHARPGHRRPAEGLPQGVAHGLHEGGRAGEAAPRLPPNRRAEPGPSPSAGARSHDDHWPPHALRLRSLQHRQRRGSSRRGPEAVGPAVKGHGGHNHGHNVCGQQKTRSLTS